MKERNSVRYSTPMRCLRGSNPGTAGAVTRKQRNSDIPTHYKPVAAAGNRTVNLQHNPKDERGKCRRT